MGEAIIGDITPYDGISQEEKHLREEMAIKFLACTIRSWDPRFADLLSKYWYEYEEGQTRAAMLVRQMDKLECLDQAVLYSERSGIALDEFMDLKEKITLPELQPWLEMRLKDHENLKLRQKMYIKVVFISGGPGVGKGTQCSRVATDFDFCYICAGDLLREEAGSPHSPYKEFILESIEKSVLLPPQLTI
ncbi:MAG: HD domain-containing protein 2 [Stictis urceolatum]|nr:HD domain-containing protein 2 [Stictis urceolata]